MFRNRFTQFFLSVILILAISASTSSLPVAHAQGIGSIKREFNAQTGKLSFIAPANGSVLPAVQALSGASPSILGTNPAMALVKRFGGEFGLEDPGQELSQVNTNHLGDGRLKVRYQQNYQGIPVMGGELIVNTTQAGDLYSINGEVSTSLSLSIKPTIDSLQAQQTAIQAVAKWYRKTTADFSLSEPELWIFDPALLTSAPRPAELVWRLEVTSLDPQVPVRELVLINARSGQISLHFNQIDTEWTALSSLRRIQPLENAAPTTTSPFVAAAFSPSISTYTAKNTTTTPGTLVCTQAQPLCTNGADLHADKAQAYALGTFNLYATQFGRNSIDNQGMKIISTVHYDSGFENAYWSGTQMVYGDAYGFPLADDVVAHELSHGVTQHESNLFYFYQSGAINESFSDVMGEYYDQTNSQGNDSDGVKWEIGEDISGLGPIRDLRDPALFGQPDRMSSSNYLLDDFDNGEVHNNSGINNKAAFLMVSGGTFNGKTVSPLGWDKTAAIYYEVNSNLLSSGANYSDLYYAMQVGCSNLIGQKGITSADCLEVKDALDAVEMNAQPVPNFNTEAPYCDQGNPAVVFSDGLESGLGNWTLNNGTHTRWQLDSTDGPYAHSGAHSLHATDLPEEITDATARLVALQIPSNAYLRFAQAFQFEALLGNFDGGVLEYSLNGGSTWQDAGSLMDFNGYTGTIDPGFGNPLEGRTAFVGSSHGYIGTRLNLASLGGKTVSFRWRMGLDMLGSGSFLESPSGWWLDDVQLYTCASLPGTFNKTTPASGSTGVSLSTTLSWSSSANASYYQYCYDIINDNQCNRAWSGPLAATSATITNLGASTKYYWQVRAVNAQGVTEGNSGNWGSFTTTSTLPAGTAGIETFVSNTREGRYSLPSGQSLRESYTGANNGPAKIISTNSIPFIGAERVIYKVNGIPTSFSEMMGSSNNQLDTTYWLPWYNNTNLDTQLRIANVTGSTATIHVWIGGQEMAGSPFTLSPNGSTRKSFAANNGPVKISSNVNIVAAERVIYKVNGVPTSFTEMMALPNSQRDTTYWLPWYDDVSVDMQLRFGNVSDSTATVHVWIGGQEMAGSPFTLGPGASTRTSYAGVNSGPVKIVSDGNIVVAERVIDKTNGVPTSFSEMMGLPANQLDATYWLPWYNNIDLDTQLRFGNASGSMATVHVFIGGAEIAGSPFTLAAGTSTNKSFANVNNGPVRIVSTQNIVVSERVIYKVNNVNTSFTEMMALPNSQLNTTYWLPWYNNVDLDTQLRFGVP